MLNYPCHGHQIYLNDINDNADLHRSKRISTNFDKEIYRIKKKFLTADYLQKFVASVIRIKWVTNKPKTRFKLKDKCVHPACKIYHGVCSCRETYIGETIRNVETRWNEHNMPSEKWNPWKHLNSNITHHSSWSVICNPPVKKLTLNILEAYFIVLLKPTVNDQIGSDLLHL